MKSDIYSLGLVFLVTTQVILKNSDQTHIKLEPSSLPPLLNPMYKVLNENILVPMLQINPKKRISLSEIKFFVKQQLSAESNIFNYIIKTRHLPNKPNPEIEEPFNTMIKVEPKKQKDSQKYFERESAQTEIQKVERTKIILKDEALPMKQPITKKFDIKNGLKFLDSEESNSQDFFFPKRKRGDIDNKLQIDRPNQILIHNIDTNDGENPNCSPELPPLSSRRQVSPKKMLSSRFFKEHINSDSSNTPIYPSNRQLQFRNISRGNLQVNTTNVSNKSIRDIKHQSDLYRKISTEPDENQSNLSPLLMSGFQNILSPQQKIGSFLPSIFQGHNSPKLPYFKMNKQFKTDNLIDNQQ